MTSKTQMSGRKRKTYQEGGVKWPRRRQSVLYDLNRAAMGYWHRQLVNCKEVLDYVRARGWDDPVALARRYRLGYAPGHGSDSPGFVAYTLSRGFRGLDSREDLERALLAAGLARRHEASGRVYDLFRGRLMFPIPGRTELDQLGSDHARIVAFGGRILPREQERLEKRGRPAPKYINTPETPIFKKGSLFYGWPWAAAAIQAERRVIVLEGYTDLLRVREAGILNVVACLGTAVTPEHMQSIAKLFRSRVRERPVEVVLATDADLAGRRAAERGARVVLQAGFRARIATFEGGQDPDDMLRDAGVDGVELFREAIDGAQTPVRNYLDVIEAAGTPFWSSLSALVRVLRDVQERAAGAAEHLLQSDAERVAYRLVQQGQFPVEPDNVLDLFRAARVAKEDAGHG